MFSWFKRKDARANRRDGSLLYQTVEAALAEPDDELVRIVASVAALMLCIAYSDHEYSQQEQAVVAETLTRIQGLSAPGVAALMTVLESKTMKVKVTAGDAPVYCRELVELTDKDFRLQLLDTLMALAAADGAITIGETNMLRAASSWLGIEQAEYNVVQRQHRDKLSVLKKISPA